MNNFYVKMAGRMISVSAIYQTTKQFCHEYLVGDIPEQIDFSIALTAEAMQEERKVSETTEVAGCSDGLLETLLLHRKVSELMPQFHTVMFHGSAIAVDGEVYLFTAPSGTGKSTHTRLWREYFGERAVMVNDDKPFLHLNEDGTITVYGAPWNGKHRLGSNIALPLKGLCILEQAPENEIEKVSASDAFETIYLQTYRPMKDAQAMKGTLEVISGIVNHPLYRLKCNISQEAAELSYEAMSGKKRSSI